MNGTNETPGKTMEQPRVGAAPGATEAATRRLHLERIGCAWRILHSITWRAPCSAPE